MPRGKPENLKPFNTMTVEQQREIQSKGGKASQEARKEARRWRDFYAGLIADKYLTKDEKGEIKELTFDELSKIAAEKIIAKADSNTIALWREMRQTQDGDVLEINANVSTADVTEGMSYEDKVKAAKEWAKKNL